VSRPPWYPASLWLLSSSGEVERSIGGSGDRPAGGAVDSATGHADVEYLEETVQSFADEDAFAAERKEGVDGDCHAGGGEEEGVGRGGAEVMESVVVVSNILSTDGGGGHTELRQSTNRPGRDPGIHGGRGMGR
jgi:hypothetical protein